MAGMKSTMGHDICHLQVSLIIFPKRTRFWTDIKLTPPTLPFRKSEWKNAFLQSSDSVSEVLEQSYRSLYIGGSRGHAQGYSILISKALDQDAKDLDFCKVWCTSSFWEEQV